MTGPTMRQIVGLVAERYQLPPDCITGPVRTREYVIPRYVSMQVIRSVTKASLTAIGSHFHRDHTSVMHGLRYALPPEAVEIRDAAISVFAAPVFHSRRQP